MKKKVLLTLVSIGAIGVGIASTIKRIKEKAKYELSREMVLGILNDLALEHTNACIEGDYMSAAKVAKLYDELVEKYEDSLSYINVLDELDYQLEDDDTIKQQVKLIEISMMAIKDLYMKNISLYNEYKREVSTVSKASICRQEINKLASAYNDILIMYKDLLSAHSKHISPLCCVDENKSEILHKSVRLSMNGGCVVDVVRDEDLSQHIQHCLANHYGNALIIDDKVVQYGHFKEDQESVLVKKSKDTEVALIEATVSYNN